MGQKRILKLAFLGRGLGLAAMPAAVSRDGPQPLLGLSAASGDAPGTMIG